VDWLHLAEVKSKLRAVAIAVLDGIFVTIMQGS
jgi:hypothetical protein